nr:MAG TPA: hypothetical protein [Caudoviricetes sp.]
MSNRRSTTKSLATRPRTAGLISESMTISSITPMA